MSRVEFDELLRQKIDSEDLEVDPAQWDRLAALLPATTSLPATPAKQRRILPWVTGIAASVAALIAAAWFFTVERNDQANRRVLSEKSAPELRQEIHDVTDTSSVPTKQNLKQSIQAPSGPGPVLGSHNNIAYNTTGKIQETDARYSQEIGQQETISTPVIAEKDQAVVRNNQPLLNNQQNTVADKENYTYKMPELMASSREGVADMHDGTSIGLGGGVNYGTMNAGYTLGLSARRYVSDKVFVDGTVAVLLNKNSQNTLNYTGDFMADQKALTSNARSRPSSEDYYYPAKGLYYIQFNPSIGYKVAKRVAMSVGGDFQQMLQNSANNETLMFDGGEDARLFPTFDVGITGKTEINVTPSIQAGLLYREGINNLIRNESRYVNRRYVQVQVKYSLPIR